MTFHHLRAPRPAAAPPAAYQPGPVTLALRAMQAELTKPRPVGPVTAAIRTMRAADPAFDINPDYRALRRALADRIEADIAALDMLGGDADLEGDEPEYDAGDDREEENEHGGDIQDEPHDAEEDDDPSDFEGTSLEAYGRGFCASGHDDDEDGHDAEGNTDDNGVGDMDGVLEQGFRGYAAGVL